MTNEEQMSNFKSKLDDLLDELEDAQMNSQTCFAIWATRNKIYQLVQDNIDTEIQKYEEKYMSRTVTYDSKGNEISNTAYPQTTEEKWFINDSQEAKADAGKPNLTLVPPQIVRDIAEVREYGNRKYGSRDNWKNVELERYIAALYRHLLSVVEDPLSVD